MGLMGPWAHGALDPLLGSHGLLHNMGPYTTWVPTQKGYLHNMGPYTKKVPTQHGSLHNMGPYTFFWEGQSNVNPFATQHGLVHNIR
jgi:hypothetical protein